MGRRHLPLQGVTTGRNVCVVAAALLLVSGCVGLLLSCCSGPPQRPLEIAATTEQPPETSQIPPADHEQPDPPAGDARRVNVRLAKEARSLRVGCAAGGSWRLLNQPTTYRAAGAAEWEVRPAGSLLQVGKDVLPDSAATFTPTDGIFSLDGRRYRGSLLVEPDPKVGLRAMELVALDDYVRGVVPCETPSRWPAQALMAQAVTARTFAVYRMTAPGAGRQHLTLMDMAYRGVEAESRQTDEAVRATAGIVITYAGATLPAYFHSTCGGHTSSVTVVFAEPAIVPLGGVACPWCSDSPVYRWRASIPLSEVARKLSAWGVKRVSSVRPANLDEAGRARQVVLNGTKKIDANQFRLAVGARRLKSTAFGTTRHGGDVEFSGRGWGHGVGLCQWGAHGMAKAGKSWREILNHYYPGGELRGGELAGTRNGP